MTAAKPQTERTGQVRLCADLVEMLSGIAWYAGRKEFDIAEFLDPLVRPTIEVRFAELPEGVRGRVRERIEAMNKS